MPATTMTTSRPLPDHEVVHLRWLRGSHSAAPQGSAPRSFWQDRIVHEAQRLKLDGVAFTRIAAVLYVSDRTLRRWRDDSRRGKQGQQLHLAAVARTADYQDHEPAPAPGAVERALLLPRDEPTGSRFVVRQDRSLLLADQRARPRVLALAGAASGGRRFDAEVSALRQILSARGLVLLEKAGIDLVELAFQVNLLQPDVLHLSAHVDGQGLWLMDGDDDKPIPWDALFDQFARFHSVPRLVIFSCCHSADAASAFAGRWGNYAIGCDGAVPDDTARRFTLAFYGRWLGYQLTHPEASAVREAFTDAKVRFTTRHPGAPWGYRLFPADG
jgi:hypothetical protein